MWGEGLREELTLVAELELLGVGRDNRWWPSGSWPLELATAAIWELGEEQPKMNSSTSVRSPQSTSLRM